MLGFWHKCTEVKSNIENLTLKKFDVGYFQSDIFLSLQVKNTHKIVQKACYDEKTFCLLLANWPSQTLISSFYIIEATVSKNWNKRCVVQNWSSFKTTE